MYLRKCFYLFSFFWAKPNCPKPKWQAEPHFSPYAPCPFSFPSTMHARHAFLPLACSHNTTSHLPTQYQPITQPFFFHSMQTLLMQSFSPCLCHLELNPTSIIPGICSQKETNSIVSYKRSFPPTCLIKDCGHPFPCKSFAGFPSKKGRQPPSPPSAHIRCIKENQSVTPFQGTPKTITYEDLFTKKIPSPWNA